MNWRLFLDTLQTEGGQLQLDGDDLVYNGQPKALTPERLQILKAHKAEILDFIRQDFTLHPLAYGQKSLWFEYQMTPDGAGYNISVALRIHSAVDWAALQKAFQGLVNRHPALRTTFTVAEGAPVQAVHRYCPVALTLVDASQWSEATLYEQVSTAHKAVFDLERGPLFRLNAWTQQPQAHLLLITLHHLIYDGWSNWILLDELQQLYKAALTKSKPALPLLRQSYIDYVDWQRNLIETEGERLWAYWREQLAGDLPLLDLPLDHPRPTNSLYEGASLPLTIPAELVTQLRQMAQSQGVTLYMLFLATYQVLLQRHTGQEDLLVASPMTGRSRPEFAKILGYFVSLVVLRGNLAGNLTFAELLQQSRRTVLGAFEHQDFPFQLLVERLHPPRFPNRAPIYEAIFTLQQPQASLLQEDTTAAFEHGSINHSELVQWGELTVSLYPLAQYGGAFDLFLELAQTTAEDRITGFFHYNPRLFEAATIQRLADHFLTLLSNIAQDLQQPIAQIPMLTAAEHHQLLVEWNMPLVDLHGLTAWTGQSIHQRFAAQAARTPNAIAVTLADDLVQDEGRLKDDELRGKNSAIRQLTYQELNERSNQLAHYLQRLGVGNTLGAETFVGLCVERSLEMVVAILAILKAGGA
ncbi:MAG: condensation domain-containing protein, partial [Caldilinea sp.]